MTQMDVNSLTSSQLSALKPLNANSALNSLRGEPSPGPSLQGRGKSAEDVREAFTQFVGETFFGQMIKSMRSTVGKPAYFHGGRGEEAFQSLLDQQLATELTKATADKYSLTKLSDLANPAS